jgi:hypothetical protein
MVLAPWRVEISYNVSAYSRPPFSPYVAGFDFNDDGTSNDLLPGTRVNQFGRELDRDDLVRLVDAYNRDYVNRVFKVGGNALPIQLPASFEFNDNFFTADLRVGRSFTLGPGGWRLTAFVEVFNLFNTQNFTTYGSDLSNSVTFGQPNAGFSQVFGSGGPRAAQLGVRLGF